MRDSSAPTSTGDLQAAELTILSIFQRVGFGRITITVRDGSPVLEPPPTVVRTVKLGGDRWSQPQTQSTTFELKSQVSDLFEYIRALTFAEVQIELRHGLPRVAEIRGEM